MQFLAIRRFIYFLEQNNDSPWHIWSEYNLFNPEELKVHPELNFFLLYFRIISHKVEPSSTVYNTARLYNLLDKLSFNSIQIWTSTNLIRDGFELRRELQMTLVEMTVWKLLFIRLNMSRITFMHQLKTTSIPMSFELETTNKTSPYKLPLRQKTTHDLL